MQRIQILRILGLLAFAALAVTCFAIGADPSVMTASLVGVMVTGAGNDTSIILPDTPEYILIGETDTDVPLDRLRVNIAGRDYQVCNTNVLIVAFSKYLMEGVLGADVKVGQILKIANGEMPGRQFQLTLTNSGVTTPNVYAHSTNRGGKPVVTRQETVLANTSMLFDRFTALFAVVTNIDRADITYRRKNKRYTASLTLAEMKAQFLIQNTSDANGVLGTALVIDNSDRDIQSVKLYATAGGNVDVLQANLNVNELDD